MNQYLMIFIKTASSPYPLPVLGRLFTSIYLTMEREEDGTPRPLIDNFFAFHDDIEDA
jgi:hypothetical protein